ERLREAWFGPLSAAEVAKRFRIDGDAAAQTVRNFWRDEKDAGRLPDTPRPSFARNTKSSPDVPPEASLDDESPIADPNPLFNAECDASLAAMRRHHPKLN